MHLGPAARCGTSARLSHCPSGHLSVHDRCPTSLPFARLHGAPPVRGNRDPRTDSTALDLLRARVVTAPRLNGGAPVVVVVVAGIAVWLVYRGIMSTIQATLLA